MEAEKWKPGDIVSIDGMRKRCTVLAVRKTNRGINVRVRVGYTETFITSRRCKWVERPEMK